MATTNNGTVNSLDETQIPASYTRPTVTTFTDYEFTSTRTLTVLKSTIETGTGNATMQAVIANGTIGITKQVDDIMTAMGADAVTTTVYTDWTGLSNNFANTVGTGDHLTTAAMSYDCIVTIYAKFA